MEVQQKRVSSNLYTASNKDTKVIKSEEIKTSHHPPSKGFEGFLSVLDLIRMLKYH